MRPLLPILLLWGVTAFGSNNNLLPNAGFELPFVTARTDKDNGGDPANNGRGPGWVSFQVETSGTTNTIDGGLTNEVARNGKQAIFIDFKHVTSPYKQVKLVSTFIPVISGTQYEVGIWGMTDGNDLIDAQGRVAFLKLEVDFYAQDANQSVGDPFYSVLQIPGEKDQEPFFKPDGWNQFYVKLTTPPGAVFAQVNWYWQSAGGDGEINGIMFFDDALFKGPPAPNPEMTPSPIEAASPDQSPAAPDQSPAAPDASPAAQ